MVAKNTENFLLSDMLQDEDIKLFLEIHEKNNDSDIAKKLLSSEFRRQYRTPQANSSK